MSKSEINCRKKRYYKTRHIAKKARNVCIGKFKLKFTIYKCDVCKMYHLTTK